MHSLEAIFEYDPDKAKQKTIRKSVEDYERKIQKRAAELERARLK